MVVNKLAVEASKTFRSLQGLTTLVSQQRDQMTKLKWLLCDWISARGPLDADEVADANDDNDSIVSSGNSFVAMRSAVRTFIDVSARSQR